MNGELSQWIGSGAVVALVILCLRLTNGMNKRFGKFVHKEECHQGQDNIKTGVNQRIDDFQKHFDTRINDLKDAVERNGK